ncbi:MAG: NAD(P) transhydrogenase subunit alpha [Alphaproteobacteria bacterium]|nr:NAD(P) transhydrogenase subunit alpha [Alphaproteobacteria bacterium]
MKGHDVVGNAHGVADMAETLAVNTKVLANDVSMLSSQTQEVVSSGSEFWLLMTIFVLACFVGYYVVWKVTPALHSPLMAVTNAISSVIIVGALIATGPILVTTSKIFGFIAVILSSIAIFGGFVVSHRMLSMFKKKKVR